MNSEEEILHSPKKDAVINSAPNSNEDSAILHSYKRDSLAVIRRDAGFTNNVTDEEALKLAAYKQKVSSFSKERILFLFAGILVLFGFVMFVIPFIFKNKTNKVVPVVNMNTKNKFFSPDSKIVLEIEGDFTQADFLAKVPRTPESLLFEFVPQVNGIQINKTQFLDVLNPRLKIIDAYLQEDFMYGAFGSNNTEQERFIVFKIKDSAIEAEKTLLKMEKTLYSDIKPVLAIPNNPSDTNIEFREFIDSPKITEPARVLESIDRKSVIVYGFVDNKYLVITESLDTFSVIRSKLIIGF